jgi:hypothetical protein
MHIRIVQKPSGDAYIDGLRIDKFEVGQQYEVGNMLGTLFLAERWAVPVDDPEPAVNVPRREGDPDGADPLPPNVIRSYPPYYDESPAIALERRRRSRRHSS